MQVANPTWGAPRIHGELRKLGIEVAQSTGAKYLRRHPKRPVLARRHLFDVQLAARPLAHPRANALLCRAKRAACVFRSSSS